jgi:hypothetical protein
VTVIGAVSNIFFNFSGGGPKFWTGGVDVNTTKDWPQMPSIIFLALAGKELRSFIIMKMFY